MSLCPTQAENGGSQNQTSPKDFAGRILYNLNGHSLDISLYPADGDVAESPLKGDIVQFDINQVN